jgi:hypothetical protein
MVHTIFVLFRGNLIFFAEAFITVSISCLPYAVDKIQCRLTGFEITVMPARFSLFIAGEVPIGTTAAYFPIKIPLWAPPLQLTESYRGITSFSSIEYNP